MLIYFIFSGDMGLMSKDIKSSIRQKRGSTRHLVRFGTNPQWRAFQFFFVRENGWKEGILPFQSFEEMGAFLILSGILETKWG